MSKARDVSQAKLRTYLDQSQQRALAAASSGDPVDIMSTPQPVIPDESIIVGGASASKQKKALAAAQLQKAQAQAQMAQLGVAQKQAAIDRRQQQQDISDKNQKVATLQRLTLATTSLLTVVGNRARQVGSNIGSIPSPGGIMVPLGILLVFLVFLYPVNGHTRAMWLWLTITKHAQIGQPLPPPFTIHDITQTGAGSGPVGPSMSNGHSTTSIGEEGQFMSYGEMMTEFD